MSESSFVKRILKNGLELPWKTGYQIRFKTEVKSISNRVDIVYYEYRSKSSIGFVTAVEAKLRDWKRALQQANRNKLFADRVYVALPEEYAAPAIEQLSEFYEASIGLIVVGKNKTKVFFHPPVNKVRSNLHADKVRLTLIST